MSEPADRIRAIAPPPSGPLTVVVLLGGAASERPVSLASGVSVGRALLGAGHHVVFFDPATAEKVEAVLLTPA